MRQQENKKVEAEVQEMETEVVELPPIKQIENTPESEEVHEDDQPREKIDAVHPQAEPVNRRPSLQDTERGIMPNKEDPPPIRAKRSGGAGSDNRAAEEDDTSAAVKEQLAKESTNFQWNKLSSTGMMILTLFVVNLLRGQGATPSLVGIQRCELIDWALFGILVVASACITLVAILHLRKEYAFKKSIGYPFVKGDFECTNRNAIILTSIGICGGLAMGGLGCGIGIFFIPALIRLDIHPIVATQTAHFFSGSSGIAYALVVIILKRLNVPYTLLVTFFTILGSLPGIHCQQLIVKKSNGRTQYSILVLFIV